MTTETQVKIWTPADIENEVNKNAETWLNKIREILPQEKFVSGIKVMKYSKYSPGIDCIFIDIFRKAENRPAEHLDYLNSKLILKYFLSFTTSFGKLEDKVNFNLECTQFPNRKNRPELNLKKWRNVKFHSLDQLFEKFFLHLKENEQAFKSDSFKY